MKKRTIKRPLEKSRYSPLVISLLYKLFDRRLTDRGIIEFFSEFTEPVSPAFMDTYIVQVYKESTGSSKRARLEEVLEFTLEHGGEKYLDSIVAKAIKKFSIDWLKSDEEGRKLLEELTKGKFPWDILSEKAEIVEGFKIPEKVSFIRSELRRRGYETTLHHLEEALSSLSTGNYSSANGQIRTLFEAFFIELMYDIKKSACKSGGCRKEFADMYCVPKENEAIKSFAELLHDKGAHPGKGEKHEAEFRLISAISWILYSMELSK